MVDERRGIGKMSGADRHRRDGRVVDCACLENKSAERYQGFESPSLLHFPDYSTSKITLAASPILARVPSVK